MADTKLSDLTELAATPAVDDEVYIRDVSEPAATESKRITTANLLASKGDVVGPASSTDAVIALFDSTTGKLLKVAPITLTNDGTKTTILGTAGDYNRIGDAGVTNHALASEDDLMVTGKLEVNGSSWFDAQMALVNGVFIVYDNMSVAFGTSQDAPLIYETADANANILQLLLPTGGATNVPVLLIGAGGGAGAYGNIDLGLFDGVTQPLIAVGEKNAKYASDTAMTAAGAGATMTKTAEFGSSVVGDIVRVTGGTNATAGWYWITTVTDANNIILDRNWCTGAVTDGAAVLYHSFTMLSAEGICTRITDGAPTDSSVEIDRDGWILVDVGNNKLYFRSQTVWQSIDAGADVTGSNAPQAHAASHLSAGGDAVKLDDLATPDDNTDLNFSITAHGLTPKGTNVGSFLKDDGTWAAPAGGGDVTGPASSTDNEIARQHLTTGKVLQTYTSNPPTISDTGDVNIDGDLDVENIVASGNVDGRDVSVDGTKLDGVEALADVTDATNVTAAGALMTNVAMTENEAIVLDAALSADGKYSGIVEAGTAGATLAFGDIVYLAVADSRWELAKADVAATSKGKIGICVLAAAGDASATTILLYGKVRADTAFPTFTIGAPVHISAATAGDVVVAAPTGTTNFVVRIVGYGNTGDELMFCPDNTYVELA